jgi:hypothetical protein
VTPVSDAEHWICCECRAQASYPRAPLGIRIGRRLGDWFVRLFTGQYAWRADQGVFHAWGRKPCGSCGSWDLVRADSFQGK